MSIFTSAMATMTCDISGCYCNTFRLGLTIYRVLLQNAAGITKCDNILFQSLTGMKKRQRVMIIKE